MHSPGRPMSQESFWKTILDYPRGGEKRKIISMDASEAEAAFGGAMETSFTPFITEIEAKNPPYEQLLADVWIGIVLTMLLLSCVCCMCSCLVYHKFQQWKRSVLRNNEEPEIISSVAVNIDCESLPSYTIASGLPSYEEALSQLEIIKK